MIFSLLEEILASEEENCPVKLWVPAHRPGPQYEYTMTELRYPAYW